MSSIKLFENKQVRSQWDREVCFIANVVQANLLAATTPNPEVTNQVYNMAVGDRLHRQPGHRPGPQRAGRCARVRAGQRTPRAVPTCSVSCGGCGAVLCRFIARAAPSGLARPTHTLADMCADAWRWQSGNPDGYAKG